MKRTALLGLAVSAGVALAAAAAFSAAPSARSATNASGPDQRLAKLEAQMKALQADVRTSKSDLKAAKADLITAKADLKVAKADLKGVKAELKAANASIAKLTASIDGVNGAVNTAASAVKCLTFGIVPIGRYGGGSTPVPFGYLYTSDNGANVFLTSALDMVPSGETPGAYVAAVNPTCVKTTSAARAASPVERDSQPIALMRLQSPH
jgi:hypothetical protein